MKTILHLVFLLISPLFVHAQQGEYERLLGQFFKVSGSEQTFEVAIKQTMETMRGQASDLDDKTWNQLEKEVLNTSIYDLVEMLVPVYSKYMTANDLREIIAFYESPVGKKLAANTPMITQESMQIGGQWGMQLGQKVMDRIEKEKKN